MKSPSSIDATGTIPSAANTQAPPPFVPEVVEPNPLEALNAAREQVSALTRRIGKVVEERDAARAALRRIEDNPLVMVLANLDAGTVLQDAGDKLTALVALVRRRQGKGKFVFSIAIKPFKGEALCFVPQVKVSEPAEEVAQGVFYSDDAGQLSRNDPRQRELAFSRGENAEFGDGRSEIDRQPPRERAPMPDSEDSQEDLDQVQAIIDAEDVMPSVAIIQRRMRWGYVKAARVLETLARGPSGGSAQ